VTKARAWLATSVALAACVPARRDTLVADVCRDAPEPLQADLAGLEAAARAATHVVRGRVRWTGLAIDEDGETRREFGYVVVDILEFHRGDAWSVDPRMRRAFPLLGPPERLKALGCRQGEALFFFVSLPGPEDSARPGGVPDPVFRAFGDRAVALLAFAPESEQPRVAEALRRNP
jgi:hypothetical protein